MKEGGVLVICFMSPSLIQPADTRPNGSLPAGVTCASKKVAKRRPKSRCTNLICASRDAQDDGARYVQGFDRVHFCSPYTCEKPPGNWIRNSARS